MTAAEIIAEIKPLGLESYRKVMRNHGVQEPLFGVKIEELKKIQKRIKKDYQLALDLFDTGIYDAMYLAGLIADDKKMTKADLKRWIKQAVHRPIRGVTVAWVASESLHGMELGLEWIESKDESIAATGWNTLSSLVSIKPDAELDLGKLKQLLEHIGKTLKKQPAGTRHASIAYAMNGFVIAVGSYVAPLTDLAMEIGEKNGVITVDMGDTDCKVPFAPDYIRKVKARGSIGKKRKSAKC